MEQADSGCRREARARTGRGATATVIAECGYTEGTKPSGYTGLHRITLGLGNTGERSLLSSSEEGIASGGEPWGNFLLERMYNGTF